MAAAVSGVTVALLGDLSARRELGKVGTRSDIHLHDYQADGTEVTVIVPDRYPDQLKGLSYALVGCDAACLVIGEVTPQAGEQILAADAAGIRHGAIVLTDYLQPEQVQPLLRGTVLEGWRVWTEPDWPAVREHLAAAHVPDNIDAPAIVPVDHHFDVKGVGAVVLGVVKQGMVRKNDALYAWPDRVLCPVRSIQVHDKDVSEARPGDRVGLALRNTKAEQLDRGMVLAPEDAPVVVHTAGDRMAFTLHRSPFSKQPLAAGSVVHLGIGMQFVPVRLETDAPAAGTEGTVEGTLEKGLVHLPDEPGVLWHMDNAPQRVVGRITLS